MEKGQKYRKTMNNKRNPAVWKRSDMIRVKEKQQIKVRG